MQHQFNIQQMYVLSTLHLCVLYLSEMGVPTSEFGYTPAMPRREDHEVHKGYVVAIGGGVFI